MRDDTIRVLNEFNINSFANKKNIERAEKFINPDEKLLYISPTNLAIINNATGKTEKLPGIVFLTDKRFCFNYQILFNHSTEIVPLEEIRSVNSSGNAMSGGHIQIHTIAKTYDMLVSYKKELISKILFLFDNAKSQLSNHSFSSDGTEINAFEKIEKLAELKEKGIISDEEFQQKKAELLENI